MPLKSSHGMTLLESLLSLLVFTAGVLGLLWSHQRGIVFERQQKFRDHAMHLAYNLSQRMLINPTQAHAYARAWETPPTESSFNCNAQPCDDSARVAWDLQQVEAELRQLPNGDIAISRLPGVAHGWFITVAWQDVAESFRPESPLGTLNCPAEKSCWSLQFQIHL